VREFCAGSHFELEGHPEIDTHPPGERQFVITEIEVKARNNLPKDLDERAERLLVRECRPIEAGAGDAEQTSLVQIRFTAVRRGIPIAPHFDARTDLPQPQMQSALVVGPPNEEVHCDALGRVKIRFPGMRAADHKHAHGTGASHSHADSAWVRVASGWAGNGPGSQQQCGTLGLPRVGTEVLVAFLGGDPDKPIIVSQLYNQRGTPPALSRAGELPGNRYLAGMRSREVGGQRGNQLRFDDTRGQISAQVASDHGTSQLNLGYLTHPRANGAGEPRGEGAELRTDKAVAIRGREGVLITAEASAEAEGQQLARSGLIGFAQLLQGVVDEVARLAEHHTGDEGTVRLTDLVDKLKRWDAGSNVAAGADGGAPIVAVTAPAGIVLASPETVAIGSEKKVDVASAGDTEISAGRNLFIRAARGLSAFAHALGIKLIAASGNVVMEAHNGAIQIKSSQRISLISAEGIDLQAPEIKVVGQGVQTDWCNGTITQQSTGQHVIKSSQFFRAGAGGGTPDSLNFPSTKLQTDERLVLRHRQTRKPVPNRRYIAHLEDGRTIEGVSDENGRTALARGTTLGRVRFELLPPDPST
jgi:type VI secretion system secreted protein VgrG